MCLFSFTYVFKLHSCHSMDQSFVPLYGWITFHCIGISHSFIHSSVDEHLGCFCFLTMISKSAINILFKYWIFVWIYVINYFLYIPRNGIAGPYGNSMCSILSNSHTGFHKSYTISDAQQHWMMVLTSPQPCLHLILFVFFITDMVFGIKWYFIAVFICISLITNDVGNIFMCLMDICISSLRKWLFKYFSHIGLFIVEFQSFLYIHDTRLLMDNLFALVNFQLQKLTLASPNYFWQFSCRFYGGSNCQKLGPYSPILADINHINYLKNVKDEKTLVCREIRKFINFILF